MEFRYHHILFVFHHPGMLKPKLISGWIGKLGHPRILGESSLLAPWRQIPLRTAREMYLQKVGVSVIMQLICHCLVHPATAIRAGHDPRKINI